MPVLRAATATLPNGTGVEGSYMIRITILRSPVAGAEMAPPRQF